MTGAIDGFLGAGAAKAKKTKKKLVEKTYIDDKGYMVTENVWEEVTDDEADAAPTAKNPLVGAKRPAGSGSTKPPASSNSKKAKQPGAQKSMMSFFGATKKK